MQESYNSMEEQNNNIFSELNQQQSEAVNHINGPLLILAGAGTGKTKVLTSRIANMLAKGIFPGEILAVTFTNKASKEMDKRVSTITQGRSSGVWLGTFHSIASRILRRHAEAVGLQQNFTIIDTNDQLRLAKQLFADNNIDEKRWEPKRFLSAINRWKDQGLTPDKVLASDINDLSGGKSLELYKQYQARLRALNAVDFGDLVLHNLTIFTKYPDILADYHRRFKYILVDEYQDTNISQYLWLRLLAQANKNICCVGDDDQSIYGWRGAEVGNILRFEKDFPGAKVVKLERNYRSTSHILSAASGLISNNDGRLGKKLWTEDNTGDPIKLFAVWDDREEAKQIADEIESLQSKKHKLSDMAILVRAGFQTRSFEECFINRGIPYKVIGGLRFYERMEIRDIISYLRIIMQNDDDLAFERIINTPRRGIGPTTVEAIRREASENGVSMFSAAQKMSDDNVFRPKLNSTIQELVGNFERWAFASKDMSVPEFVDMISKESGYVDMWKQDKNTESQGRVENIKELIHALEDFTCVAEFLEHVSLVTDIEADSQEQMVSIMTLHAAKGLEFDNVFLPGWEDGIFPHQRSIDETGRDGLEEERRLAYVGITRAKQRAYILYAGNRRVYGQYQSSIPSRFIAEIPEENIERIFSGNGFNFSVGGGGNSSYKKGYSESLNSAKSIPTAKSNESSGGYKKGERIFHIKFGYGKILSASGDQLDILFDKAGNKKIIERYVEKA